MWLPQATMLTLCMPAIYFNQFQYTHWRLPSSFSNLLFWQVKTLVPSPYNQKNYSFHSKTSFHVFCHVLPSFRNLLTIHDLMDDEHIVIIKADKGSNVVIMDKCDYLKEGKSQL